MPQRFVANDTEGTTAVQQSAGGALRQGHGDISQLCAQEMLYHGRKINQTQIHPTSSCVLGARGQNKTETRHRDNRDAEALVTHVPPHPDAKLGRASPQGCNLRDPDHAACLSPALLAKEHRPPPIWV